MSWSVSIEVDKHNVREALDAHYEQCMTTSTEPNRQQFITATETAVLLVDDIPNHMAGARVVASGHADEHVYNVSVAVSGVHLTHRADAAAVAENPA